MSSDKIYNSGKFNWCLDIEYPITVKNRCVFFYAAANKYRVTLNNANYFSKDNNICVVFIYGKLKQESLVKYIKQSFDGNLIVVHYSSNMFNDMIIDVEEYYELLKKYKSRGVVDSLTNEFKADYLEKLKQMANTYEELSQEHNDINLINDKDNIKYELLKINSYIHSEKRLQDLQRKSDFVIYHNCNVEHKLQIDYNKYTIDELPKYIENIIYLFYPYGIEVSTIEPYAYKNIASKRIVKNILAGNTNSGKLGIQLDSNIKNSTVSVVKIIQTIDEYISKKIRINGYFCYGDLIDLLTKPPYGYQENNWYAYILTVALVKYRNYYQKNAVLSIEYSELQIEWLITSYYHQTRKSEEFKQQNEIFIYKPSKKYFEIIDMVSELINDKFKPKTITDSMAHLFTYLSKKQDGKILPLALLNVTYSELSEITYTPMVNIGGIKKINYVVNKGWFQSESVNHIWHFLKDNYNYHKKILSNPNNAIAQKLYRKYPDDKQKVNLFIRYYNKVFPNDTVWLYDKEFVISLLEEYMSKEIIVCKECGDYLVKPQRKAYVIPHKSDNEIKSLTEKEIIGLNLKLLDSHANSYYCLPCLSELINCTESELWQKTQDFKEEGCTLFS